MAEKRQKRYEETRDRLMDVAWSEFAVEGYARAATETIVAKAGMTRGALYYHFKDKAELFRAVVELAHIRILGRIEAAAASAPTVREGLRSGCLAFIAASADPAIRQIALIDGPAVLGWAEWRKIDARYGFGSLCAGLEEANRQGMLKTVIDPIAAAYLLSGAMNEAALALSDTSLSKAKRNRMRRSMEEALLVMLDSLVE